ncbi:MAG: hypothetical protein ACFFG0_03870 [Candidatus Thorarchaeota archaeon]
MKDNFCKGCSTACGLSRPISENEILKALNSKIENLKKECPCSTYLVKVTCKQYDSCTSWHKFIDKYWHLLYGSPKKEKRYGT